MQAHIFNKASTGVSSLCLFLVLVLVFDLIPAPLFKSFVFSEVCYCYIFSLNNALALLYGTVSCTIYMHRHICGIPLVIGTGGVYNLDSSTLDAPTDSIVCFSCWNVCLTIGNACNIISIVIIRFLTFFVIVLGPKVGCCCCWLLLLAIGTLVLLHLPNSYMHYTYMFGYSLHVRVCVCVRERKSSYCDWLAGWRGVIVFVSLCALCLWKYMCWTQCGLRLLFNLSYENDCKQKQDGNMRPKKMLLDL